MNLWTWHVTRGRNSEDLVLARGRIKFTCCLVAFLIKNIYCHNTKISRKSQVWMTSVAMWICNEIFRVWLQELKFNILTSRQLVIGKIHELSQMVVTSSQLKIVLRIFLSKFWQFTMDGAFCVNRKVAVFDSRSTWTSHSLLFNTERNPNVKMLINFQRFSWLHLQDHRRRPEKKNSLHFPRLVNLDAINSCLSLTDF